MAIDIHGKVVDYKKFTIVLPTLNEEETAPRLVHKLMDRYKGIHIIVEDDSSDATTAEKIRKIASGSKSVKIVRRREMQKIKGLSSSVIDGILSSDTEYSIVMDADFQHPYEKVADIARKLDEGYNIVVANRKEVKEWPLYRKIISLTLIRLADFILTAEGRQRCDDVFSGFFGVRCNFFANIYCNNSKRFVKNGFKILFDLLKCIDKGSIKICNVPYSFGTRGGGSSKAGVKQAMALLKSFIT